MQEEELICKGMTGIFKHFKQDYGFITPDDPELDDVFVHFSEIEPWRNGFKEAEKGQKATFDIYQSSKGLHAKNVEIRREADWNN